MLRLCFVYSMCFALAVSQGHLDLYENQTCNEKKWICKRIGDCPWAAHALLNGTKPTICSFLGSTPIVCCPPFNQTIEASGKTNQTEISQTGVPAVKSKRDKMCWPRCVAFIAHGTEARQYEFPHMALIGYGTDRNAIKWACGGSLISEYFVLSAAHCSNPVGTGPASWAKLGVLNQHASSGEYKIVQRIDHPQYKPPRIYNDISLFKLEEDPMTSVFIYPACLPDSEDIPYDLLVTGWGHTEFGGVGTETLQKASISFVNITECKKIYKGSRLLPEGLREDSQICAGHFERDTCQGDSGGPLQVSVPGTCRHMLHGITSFGRFCGNNYPGVYTKVYHYMDWIEQIVWP